MHFYVPTRQVILESPDCGGKTSLFNELHRQTQFNWNLHDRSQLSMLVYALQYSRTTGAHRDNLRYELSDLNNRFIYLTLPVEVHIERYRRRGDVMQNEESLRRQHAIFTEQIKDIRYLPHVLCLGSDNVDSTVYDKAKTASQWLSDMSYKTLDDIGYFVSEFIDYSSTTSGFSQGEASPRITFEDHQPYEKNVYAFNVEDERDYYLNIRSDFLMKVAHETRQIANDCVIELSRRFIFSGRECISCIHMLIRNSVVYVNVYLRSSLCAKLVGDLTAVREIISDALSSFDFQTVEKVVYNVQFGSAHTRT